MSAWPSSTSSAGHRTAPRHVSFQNNLDDAEPTNAPPVVQLPLHFNPHRLAHVRLLAEAQQAARARAAAEKQARELEAQARERELAELRSLARAPAQPPASVTEQWSDADRMHLFRLPGSMQSAAAYSTAPSFYKTKSPTNRPKRRGNDKSRSPNIHQDEETRSSRRQPHVQRPSSSTRSRSPSLSSEYDNSTPSTPEARPSSSSRPGTAAAADDDKHLQTSEAVNSTPIHPNVAPQGSKKQETDDGIESINLPSLTVHSPNVTRMRAIDDELEEIERQLRGEPARSHPHRSPSSSSSSSSFLSPQYSVSSQQQQQHGTRTTPFTPPPPISPVRPFLSTVDRNLIERYRREQEVAAAERDIDINNSNGEAIAMNLEEAIHSVLDGVDLHPHSVLNDSLPSTIGEERSEEIQTRDKELTAEEQEEKIAEEMFQKLPDAPEEQGGIHSAEPAVARPQDPLSGVTSSSLSDRLRLTDLQYPDMAPAWAHRSSIIAASPWRHPLFYEAPFPGHDQRNAHPLQGKPLFESVEKLEKAALQKELQFRLSNSPMLDATPLLDKGLSSRAMLDPPSRLLENLWQAEEEFERMLHEEPPVLLASNKDNTNSRTQKTTASMTDKIRTRTPLKSFANADQYRAYFDLDRPPTVEYAPGNFIQPDSIVSHAYLKPVQQSQGRDMPEKKRKPSKSPRASEHRHHSRQQEQKHQLESDIASELESILDPLSSNGANNNNGNKHTFLGVSDWNGENDVGALLSTPILESSTVSGTPQLPGHKVLVGVNDYELPGDLLDVLDVDVDSMTGQDGSSRLAKLHPARGFGHLVPLNNLAVAHALEKARAQAERAKRMQGKTVEEEKQHPMMQQQLQTPTTKSTARRGSLMPPRSGSQSSLRSQQGKVRSRSVIASPTAVQQPERGRIARSPPPVPKFSHLHAAPDPVQLHKHVAARKIHESMAEMDEDLQRLEERALALAAEHQADQRELEAYQKRLAQRQNGFFEAKLTKAQQAWMETERNTRRAQDTLAQIEAVLAERAPAAAAPTQRQQQISSPQASPRKSPRKTPRLSPKLSPSRRPGSSRANVVHSPLLLPQAATSSRETPPVMQDLGGIQQQEVPMLGEAPTSRRQQHRNVQHSPIGKPQSNPYGISPALIEATRAATQRTQQQPLTIPRTVKKQPVKKKAGVAPMAKLEHDLDNVLSQAQDLMNNFMANIK